MRNLKRVLSLALAVIMVIGMMVMTTSAADIADIDEVKYAEAVAVMNALEVLEGDENGNFNPTQILTREQAAKIICFIMMGPDNAELLTGSGNFTDVAADRWSAGYIDYCATMGIIAGNGDGTFNPTGKLTGVAFAKMLLGALGYDAQIEGYVNNANWATNIATDAYDVGLNIRGVNLAAEVTREQAAQMAFQALESTMVYYGTKGTNITTADGTVINVGATGPYLKGDPDDIEYNSDVDGYLQLCEKYFSDLSVNKGASDAFGRPAAKWYIKNQLVVSAVEEPIATFTEETAMPKVAAALAGYRVSNGTDTYKIDTDTAVTGVTVSGQNLSGNPNVVKKFADLTKDGRLVEVFADRKNVVYDIVIVDYTLDKCTDVVAAKDKTTYSFVNSADKIDYVDEEKTDSIVLTGGKLSKGDVITTATVGSTLFVYPTTSFVGTQTSWNTDDEIVIDGETYRVAKQVTGYESNLLTNTYLGQEGIFYLDQFGLVLDTEAIAVRNYAYVVDSDVYAVNGVTGGYAADVRVVLADGTVGVYDLAIKPNGTISDTALAAASNTGADTLKGTWAYTLEDGVLTLKPLNGLDTATTTMYGIAATTSNTVAANTTSATVDSKTVLFSDSTVFVVYNATTKKATVYNGLSSLPSTTSQLGEIVLDRLSSATMGTASVVFMTGSLTPDDVKDYVYIDGSDYTAKKVGAAYKYDFVGTAADGSTVTVTLNTNSVTDGVYTYASDLSAINAVNASYLKSDTVATDAGDNMIEINNSYYQMTEDTDIVYLSKAVSNWRGKAVTAVLKVVGGNVTNTVETLYVTSAN